MPNTVPTHTLIARIHSPEFEKECPRYVAYAARLLFSAGQGEGRDHRPAAIQAEELLADTTVACSEGKRKWREDVDFFTFFCHAMCSMAYNARRRLGRRRTTWLEDIEEPPAPSSRRGPLRDTVRQLDAAREVLSGDPRTKEMLEAIENGAEKPSDLVDQLGWTPEYAKAVRVIANRRLDGAGLRKGNKKKKVG